MTKTKTITVLLAAALLACAAAAFGQTVPPNTRAEEQRLLGVIQSSGADRKEKSDAFRQLSFIATKDSVSAMAAFLGDDQFAHNARNVLETVNDPSVDEAFRKALGQQQGLRLVGVIGSVGVRKDAKAIQPLTKYLKDSDPRVAQAAARALGDIGNMRAANALLAALKEDPKANQLNICEGLFRCAEDLSALKTKRAKEKAVEAYDFMLELDSAHQVRSGAVRGAILARGKDGPAFLRKQLRHENYLLFTAAVQTSLEMEGEDVTKALTEIVKDLPEDNRILIAQALGKRGDASAVPTLLDLAREEEKPVRLAALGALPPLCRGPAAKQAAPALLKLLDDADADVAKAAQASLGSIGYQAWYGPVVKMLEGGDERKQLIAIELMGRRRVSASIPKLIGAVGDNDSNVRQAAVKMVAELGEAKHIGQLVDAAMELTETQDLSAVERALLTLCSKTENTEKYAVRTAKLAAKASPAQKAALLRVLSAMGGPDALDTIRQALKNSDETTRDGAVRALEAWKTADAAPDLLDLAKNADNRLHQIRGLRGYLGVARDESLSASKKLAMCKEAAKLVERNDEKKLLLGALAGVASIEALDMAMGHMDNNATRDEACLAVVSIGGKIQSKHREAVAAAMRKVLKTTKNRGITKNARGVLDKVR